MIRMSPEQIAQVWPAVRGGIAETLLPTAGASNETMQKVLRSLLSEDMQLWVSGNEEGEAPSIVIVTTIYKDVISDTASLLIYAFFETMDAPPMVWSHGLRKLKDFAVMNKCENLIAYTENPNVVDIARTLGFKPITFLRMEV